MTAPVGMLSLPLAALRELIAGSPAFQEWVGAGDATEALARVHLLAEPRNAEGPWALIDFGDFRRERTAVQNRRAWSHGAGCNMVVWFHADVLPDLTDTEAILDFTNHVGLVWADMEILAGQYDQETFAATLIELAVAPERIEPEKRELVGDYFECAISPTFSRSP